MKEARKGPNICRYTPNHFMMLRRPRAGALRLAAAAAGAGWRPLAPCARRLFFEKPQKPAKLLKSRKSRPKYRKAAKASQTTKRYIEK